MMGDLTYGLQMSLPYDKDEFEDTLTKMRRRLELLETPNKKHYEKIIDLMDENHRINMALIGAIQSIDDIFTMLERKQKNNG